MSTGKIVKMLRSLFDREGVPKCIVSDNGSQFTSQEFAGVLEEFGIHHQKAAVYHLLGNSLVELSGDSSRQQ